MKHTVQQLEAQLEARLEVERQETEIPRLDRRRPEDVTLKLSVNNRRCHRYGICQMEADAVFWLAEDGRLRYDARPPAEQHEAALQAARMCPMQAIAVVEEKKHR